MGRIEAVCERGEHCIAMTRTNGSWLAVSVGTGYVVGGLTGLFTGGMTTFQAKKHYPKSIQKSMVTTAIKNDVDKYCKQGAHIGLAMWGIYGFATSLPNFAENANTL